MHFKTFPFSGAFSSSGMVWGYAVGVWMENIKSGWRLTFGLHAALGLVFGLGVLYLPESARWLISQVIKSA